MRVDCKNVIASVEAEVVMLAINTSTSNHDPNESELSPSKEVVTTEDPDLPLSKKCKVSKAEKRLLCR